MLELRGYRSKTGVKLLANDILQCLVWLVTPALRQCRDKYKKDQSYTTLLLHLACRKQLGSCQVINLERNVLSRLSMYPLDVSVNMFFLNFYFLFFLKQATLKASLSALKQSRAAFNKGGWI